MPCLLFRCLPTSYETVDWVVDVVVLYVFVLVLFRLHQTTDEIWPALWVWEFGHEIRPAVAGVQGTEELFHHWFCTVPYFVSLFIMQVIKLC